MLRRAIVLAIVSLGVLAGAPPATAQADLGVRHFLADLYDQYKPGRPAPHPLGKQAEQIFAPSLLGLIRRDQNREAGEVGALDYDPICACQDYDNLQVKEIAVRSTKRDSAEAQVTFVNSGVVENVEYLLTSIGGHWRISDIRERGMNSLLTYLEVALHSPMVPPKAEPPR